MRGILKFNFTDDFLIAVKNFLDYRFIIPLALLLGLAPFYPQPHLAEKIGMFINGTLRKPLDIFDLLWHTWPVALLAYRIFQDIRHRN